MVPVTLNLIELDHFVQSISISANENLSFYMFLHLLNILLPYLTLDRTFSAKNRCV